MKWFYLFVLYLIVTTECFAQTMQSDQDLADRFKPFIKTSLDDSHTADKYRPTKWQLYVRHSQMIFTRAGEDHVVVPSNGWDDGFDNLLSEGDDLSKICSGYFGPDLGHDCHDTGLKLPLDLKTFPHAQRGEDWAQVLAGDGVYAHVERVGKSLGAGGVDSRLVNIDYTIVWANNSPRGGYNGGHLGQHDGDLSFLIVLYDPISDRIVRVTYPAHGCIIQLYEIVPAQTARLRYLKGQTIDKSVSPARLFTSKSAAIQVDISRENISSEAHGVKCAVDGAFIRSTVNHIFFTQDASSGNYRFEHPVVYIENGTHESWPNRTGRLTDAGNHDGDGPSWLPAAVELLGSYASPTAADTPFLHFNGKFGSDSASLVLHRSWCWPHNDNYRADDGEIGDCSKNNAGFPDSLLSDLSPYQDFELLKNRGLAGDLFNESQRAGSTRWPQVISADPSDYYATFGHQEGNGSIDKPYGGIDVALTFVPAGSTLHLMAGYYVVGRLEKRMIFKASSTVAISAH